MYSLQHTTTMSSREFNQATNSAKQAALHGPVIITDRGKPEHVLVSIKYFQRLTKTESLLDALACPASADIAFEPMPLANTLCKPVDFS